MNCHHSLEHFPTIWNHEGFQFWRYSDSRYGLVEEASLYGEISFDGSTRTADISCSKWDVAAVGREAFQRCALDRDQIGRPKATYR